MVLEVIGWVLIVWSVIGWFMAHTPIQISISGMYGNLLRSMGILHLLLGIAFILNGLAITKIIETTRHELERVTR